jgi:hypothetical protein
MSLNARNRQRRILGLTVVDLVMRFSNQQVLAPRPTGVRASLPKFFLSSSNLRILSNGTSRDPCAQVPNEVGGAELRNYPRYSVIYSSAIMVFQANKEERSI